MSETGKEAQHIQIIRCDNIFCLKKKKKRKQIKNKKERKYGGEKRRKEKRKKKEKGPKNAQTTRRNIFINPDENTVEHLAGNSDF